MHTDLIRINDSTACTFYVVHNLDRKWMVLEL